jgi:Outer membrane protein beta-barrel domain
MNERILNDDEFEKLLKEKADQFKMYPSDKVWSEVNSSLHTKRRRFVAGMTFLIGSFLILAGIQLISPSPHVRPDTIATKINTAAKPAPANDLQSSASNGFVAGSINASNNPHVSDPGLVSSSPFALGSLVSSDTESGSAEWVLSQPEKIQTTTRMNSIQPSEAALAGKPGSALTVPDLNETEPARINIPVTNVVSAELSPEKSITHLTHTRNDRFSWEIYITPTLNKRYLTGMSTQTLRQSLQNAPIMVVRFANVNGFVDNTPAMGYNLGGNIVYRISKNISLKAGLEFSYSRYYIKAYNSNPSQASSSLSPYLGYIPDSLVNFNAGNGLNINKGPQHYQNKYFQLSMPVGVEMKVAGSGKLQLHLGATIQPSYLLNTDSYVLSEDYNSYLKDAPAYRRWNLNAGAEVFISYGVGQIRWELGPEVRYQIFSTYKNSYPFNENMLNYGIRIGFSKTIW